MNKFVKKLCAATLISIMAGSMVACGNTNTSKEVKKTANGKVEIEYWYGLGGKLDENMQKL